MRCVANCIGAALMMGMTACEAQKADNEAQPANEAVQATKEDSKSSNEAQTAAKVAAAKCRGLATQLPVQVPDLTRKTYACVERHALLYAKGPDSIEALSKAVMAKCKDTIVRYVDQESKKAGVRPEYKEPFESWQGHTYTIIAEARARGCYG